MAISVSNNKNPNVGVKIIKWETNTGKDKKCMDIFKRDKIKCIWLRRGHLKQENVPVYTTLKNSFIWTN